ncbi:hypothetical protein GSN00_07405 [Cylindrospermopsis raciborskii CHAB3438]|uniref:hypothetical protein n=1 Tax=Cylindrospermopsis raciborskii TaxID=77022 RepID=UPI001F1157FD|nr:hypothetical protein [Cylindrospermopsis raciborskii]MCH4904216.1 hypothetical protein [Cylindrospermopsis raciborskii CHAB3438]
MTIIHNFSYSCQPSSQKFSEVKDKIDNRCERTDNLDKTELKEQTFSFLTRLGFTPGKELWIKTSKRQVLRAVVGKGELEVFPQRKVSKVEDPKGGSVWRDAGKSYGWEFLYQLCQETSLFFLPNHPQGGIGKGHCTNFSNLFFEVDDLPLDQQFQNIENLKSLGLLPSAIVFSGGKSFHTFLSLTEDPGPDQWVLLQKKLICLTQSDPAIKNLNREMRLPGFFRPDKGKYQSLVSTGDRRYSIKEIEDILQPFFPHGLSDERWNDWRLAEKSQKNEILSMPEESLPTVVSKIERQKQLAARKQLVWEDENNLIELVNKTAEQATIEDFEKLHPFKVKWFGKRAKSDCPFHQSQSGTAGWFGNIGGKLGWACPIDTDNRLLDHFRFFSKLRYGKENPTGKEWVDIAKAYLTEMGIAFSDWKPVKNGKLAKFGEEIRAKDIEDNRVEESQDLFALLKKAGKSLCKIAKGFGKEKHVVSNLSHTVTRKTINVKEIKKEILDAYRSGYKNIIVKTPPGSGKTHTAGTFMPDELSVNKILYVTNGVQNPTVLTLVDWSPATARHGGLRWDTSQKTADGRYYLRRTKKGEKPDIQPNCIASEVFEGLRQQEVNVDNSSVICDGCPVSGTCKSFQGFLIDRKTALEQDRVRIHPESIDPTIFDSPLPIGVIWDENILKFKKDITFNETDLNATLGFLAHNTEVLVKFLPLLNGIREFFKEKSSPYNGYEREEILARLPEVTREHLDLATNLVPDLSFLENFFNGVHGNRSANLSLRKESIKETAETINNMGKQWLLPFVRAITEKGFLYYKKGVFTISVPEEKHTKIMEAAKVNIILDATADPEYIVTALKMQREKTIVLTSEVETPNLKIKILTGMGNLRPQGKERTSSKQKRVDAIREKFLSLFPDGVVFEYKSVAREGDRVHFRDSRANNTDQEKKACLLLGVPIPNLADARAAWEIGLGGGKGFDDYLGRLTVAEICQTIGRLRASRRPKEEIIVYIAGDTRFDLAKALKENFNGAEITTQDVGEICPEAGDASHRVLAMVSKGVRKLIQEGRKVTQQNLAKIAGIGQSTIAESIPWAKFKKISEILLGRFNTESDKKEPELLPDESWFIDQYLPILIEEEVSPQEVIETLERVAQTPERIAEMLSRLPKYLKQGILWLLCKDLEVPWQLSPS